ncbi:MAG: M3 family oligoendopeptidase [Bacillota bacterium]
MQTHLNPTWNLEVIFPGGAESQELAAFVESLEADIRALRGRLETVALPTTPSHLGAWSPLLREFQELAKRLRQAGAFAGCLNAQNMGDQSAKLVAGRISQLGAAFGSAATLLDHQILQLSDEVLEALLADPEFAAIEYPIRERRARAAMKMDPQRESLVGDLSVDGYHAWGRLYDAIVARIQIPWEESGKTVYLSAGQVDNKMKSGDRLVRSTAFAKWEKAWAEQSDLIAEALNHLAGYRIQLYKHRGWDSILSEPLENNRMKAETLNVMWEVIERNKPIFVEFLHRKAKLLGLEKLAWHDVTAPLGGVDRKVTYDEAAAFIVEQFRRFSPHMAELAQRAFDERWVEAEDRPGKRPGAFCATFPLSQQSRVFMTFAGNPNNVATLAHELGHAYHGAVMRDLPTMAQGYAMNVAETASTLAEMIVADASVKAATSAEERLVLLDNKAGRGVTMFMNIHCRFLFETRFYEERKRGLVSVKRLNELMEQAQRDAFHDALSEYHPHFWASKGHFYSTGQPFYNFPYTFGYLFSSGIYARALKVGPSFAGTYVDLLRDTGRMRVEDLAMKHLGVDLTRPDFWQEAVDVSVADVKQFLELTADR